MVYWVIIQNCKNVNAVSNMVGVMHLQCLGAGMVICLGEVQICMRPS